MFSLGERGPQTLMGAESGLINSPIRRKDAPGYSGPQVVFHLQQWQIDLSFAVRMLRAMTMAVRASTQTQMETLGQRKLKRDE
jgi:hypothetical protein